MLAAPFAVALVLSASVGAIDARDQQPGRCAGDLECQQRLRERRRALRQRRQLGGPSIILAPTACSVVATTTITETSIEISTAPATTFTSSSCNGAEFFAPTPATATVPIGTTTATSTPRPLGPAQSTTCASASAYGAGLTFAPRRLSNDLDGHRGGDDGVHAGLHAGFDDDSRVRSDPRGAGASLKPHRFQTDDKFCTAGAEAPDYVATVTVPTAATAVAGPAQPVPDVQTTCLRRV